MKIGVMFGSPETTTGGNALKFYASVRLDIRRIGSIKERDDRDRQPDPREGRQEQAGTSISVRSSSISCMVKGVSKTGELVDLGVQSWYLVEKSGAWFCL
jgi:recombination protein RecA